MQVGITDRGTDNLEYLDRSRVIDQEYVRTELQRFNYTFNIVYQMYY